MIVALAKRNNNKMYCNWRRCSIKTNINTEITSNKTPNKSFELKYKANEANISGENEDQND